MQSKKRYIIRNANTRGRRVHIPSLIAIWLLMDRLNAPEWLYGIYWFIIAIIAVAFFYDVYTYEEEFVDMDEQLQRWYIDQKLREKANA